MKVKYKTYSVVPTATVPDGIVHRPEIAIRIVGPARSTRVLALLDSGADETILPLDVAKRLDVRLSVESESHAIGVTGHPLSLMPGEVELEIAFGKERFRWKTLVSFAEFEDSDAECAVLGHLGALRFFTVTFDGAAHIATIEPNPSFYAAENDPRRETTGEA